MSYGRKNLADGSIAETRRSMNKRDISQESKFFMKQARKILWRELRGTSLKTSKYLLIFVQFLEGKFSLADVQDMCMIFAGD